MAPGFPKALDKQNDATDACWVSELESETKEEQPSFLVGTAPCFCLAQSSAMALSLLSVAHHGDIRISFGSCLMELRHFSELSWLCYIGSVATFV